MKKFAVYQKTPEKIIFVQENFNIIAGIFNIFWALYNKVWPMVIIGLLVYSVDFAIYNGKFSIVMFTTNFLIFSLLSDFIYSIYLEKCGFILTDVIIASDYRAAEVKFLERLK